MRFADTIWNIQHSENGDLLQISDGSTLFNEGVIRSQNCVAFPREV